MPETYLEHPVTYRQEIVEPLFKRLRSGESCTVIGAASSAKSNLVRFLLRRDVQQHYLRDEGERSWMVLVDLHRLTALSEWAFYELLLHSLVIAAQSRAEEPRLLQVLSDLHREVALSENRLLAQRYVERAVTLLSDEMGLLLAFLLDEIDAFYKAADAPLFHNLRALRDAHKYRLCYVLIARAPLDQLRSPHEREAFYELFSRNTLGLGPYRHDDAVRMVRQLEMRKGLALLDEERKLLVEMCGGHPGLLVAAFDTLDVSHGRERLRSAEMVVSAPGVREECQRLWKSLSGDEQRALVCVGAGFSEGEPTRAWELAALKGLIVQDAAQKWCIFSPMFAQFVAQVEADALSGFRVDRATASVFVAGKRIPDLSQLEFSLAELLYEHRGQVLTRDEILAALHPKETTDAVDELDSSVDSLISRLRKKVEPAPSQPRYILTVRGHGYKLAGSASPETG